MARRRANGEGALYKRADGRWEARYTDHRELDPKKQTKFITKKNQKDVVEQLKKIQAEIAGGERLLVTENPIVADWLTRWLRDYMISELRDSTFENYEGNIEKHLIPLIGHIRLKELTGTHIQQMFNKMMEPKKTGGHGLNSATVAKNKNILSGALQQAIVNKIIRFNPLDETKPPKVEDADIRIMTKEEQQKFNAVLPFYNTGNMFAVSLATGLRIGELCALDINDINREEKYIDISKTAGRRKDKHTGEASIKVGPPKTKYSRRRIPLLPSIEVMLDRQAQLVTELRDRAGDRWKDNTLVFPTDIGNIHDLSGMRSSMGRILKRAGLPHMTIHALRHTYATTALNAGVAAQNVARILGHKDGATTLKFYAHYINTEAMIQLEKLEKQNITNLGISASDLERIVMGAAETLEKVVVPKMIDEVILRAKNFPPKKSVEMVLSVCEDILCRPIEEMSATDKDILIGVLARYTVMKRQIADQEKAAVKSRPKKKATHEI